MMRRFLVPALVLTWVVVGCGGGNPATQAATPVPPMAAVSPDTSLVSQVVPDLLQTWNGYKQDFIQGDGRVIDHGRGGVTTSEGQSYAMLRAVWAGDRPEFDLLWKWTQDNLQVRKHDHLFGFLWGRNKRGTWSILSRNSATDADEDIALALVFASHQWNDSTYLTNARAIIASIWHHEIALIKGTPVLTAGNWAPIVKRPGPQIDPSYFAPYAYRIFGGVDPSHPWHLVVDSSYRYLTACTESSLGSKTSAGLPPNWCSVTSSGQVAPAHESHAGVYGYDAFRSQWRIALDYLWFHDHRAWTYLQRVSFLRRAWNRSHALFSQYRHDGTPLSHVQDPTIYGGDLGNFVVTDPAAAAQIATEKLLPTFHTVNGVAYWDLQYSYYEQNWVWFGLALLTGQLPNLTVAHSPSTALTYAAEHGGAMPPRTGSSH